VGVGVCRCKKGEEVLKGSNPPSREQKLPLLDWTRDKGGGGRPEHSSRKLVQRNGGGGEPDLRLYNEEEMEEKDDQPKRRGTC